MSNWLADTDDLRETHAERNTLILESPPPGHPQQRPSQRRATSSPQSRGSSHHSPKSASKPAATHQQPFIPPPPPPPVEEPSEEMLAEIMERLITQGEWCKAFDAESGRTYFYNPTSRATTWNLKALVAREYMAYASTSQISELPSESYAPKTAEQQQRVSSPKPRAAARGMSPTANRPQLNKARAASKQRQQPRVESPEQKQWRLKVIELYRKHNPAKLMVVDELLLRYEGREAELWRNLKSKYSSTDGTPANSPRGDERPAMEPPQQQQQQEDEEHDATRELFADSNGDLLLSPRLRGISPGGDTSAVGTHHSHPRYRDDDALHEHATPPEPQGRVPNPQRQESTAVPKRSTPSGSKGVTPRTTTPKRAVGFGRAVSPTTGTPSKRTTSQPRKTTAGAPSPGPKKSKVTVAFGHRTTSPGSSKVPAPAPKKTKSRVQPAPKASRITVRPDEDPDTELRTPDASDILPDDEALAAQAAAALASPDAARPAWQNRSPPASGRVSGRVGSESSSPHPKRTPPKASTQQRTPQSRPKSRLGGDDDESPPRDRRPTTPSPYSPQQHRVSPKTQQSPARSPGRASAPSPSGQNLAELERSVEDQTMEPPIEDSIPRQREGGEGDAEDANAALAAVAAEAAANLTDTSVPAVSTVNSTNDPSFEFMPPQTADTTAEGLADSEADGRQDPYGTHHDPNADAYDDEDYGDDDDGYMSPRSLAEEKARQILLGTTRARNGGSGVTRGRSGVTRNYTNTLRGHNGARPLPRVAQQPRWQGGGYQGNQDSTWQDELDRRDREAAARREYLQEEKQRAAQRRNYDLQRRMAELQRIREEEHELRQQHAWMKEQDIEARRQQRHASPTANSRMVRQASTRGQLMEDRYQHAAENARSHSAPRRRGDEGGDFDTSSPMFTAGWKVGRAIEKEGGRRETPSRGRKKMTAAEIQKSADRLQRHYSSPAAKSIAAARQQEH